MSKLNKEVPLSRIELLGEFPLCVAKDGTTVVALQWTMRLGPQGQRTSATKSKCSQPNLRGISVCWSLSLARSRRGYVRNWKHGANWSRSELHPAR